MLIPAALIDDHNHFWSQKVFAVVLTNHNLVPAKTLNLTHTVAFDDNLSTGSSTRRGISLVIV